ncbi:hypothetical protein GO290_01953 [Ralstonia solanacearum]|nr:hypothetical protein [Ralstonia solanacearum]
MKTQIDNLVRGIQHDLAQPSPTVPELAAFFQAIGADGFSKAVEQRAILARWAKDMSLLPGVRDYARQQLDSLPAF